MGPYYNSMMKIFKAAWEKIGGQRNLTTEEYRRELAQELSEVNHKGAEAEAGTAGVEAMV